MEIYIGDIKIQAKYDIIFKELKVLALKTQKIFVKYFSFNGDKINELLRVSDYPLFELNIDPNPFKEYKKGKFRCGKCRKYLRMSNWTCSHTPRCKAKYLFNKEYTKQISGRYEFNFEEEIEEKISKKFDYIKRNNEKKKADMLNKINELLGFNK